LVLVFFFEVEVRDGHLDGSSSARSRPTVLAM
jgi:hypothetical protein